MIEIGLGHYLTLGAIIFTVGVIGIFLKTRFDVITTITPKAGLLGMLASFLTFIPMRVHCFTGQVWSVKKGLKRIFFKLFDNLLNAAFESVIISVSLLIVISIM